MFREVVSTTRPFSFLRIASNAPSVSASRRAADSAAREMDLHWLRGPEIRRTEVATWSVGWSGTSGSAREVIAALPRVVALSPAVIVIRIRPSDTAFDSAIFLAACRSSSTGHANSIPRISRLCRSRAKCASSRNGAPRWMRIVSKAPSPWRNPRLRTGTRAASSDTTAPSSHAKAVRGHLHAIPRDRLRVPAEFVERLAVFRLRRSEEHTSELQSHVNLVCRLLLEKKKKKKLTPHLIQKKKKSYITK